MDKTLIAIALALVSMTAFAKDKPKPTITNFMQNSGILYLEAVDDLTLACGNKSFVDDDCMSRWQSGMESLEDRINIAISKPNRPEGDKQFMEILKEVKYAKQFWATARNDGLDQKAWMKAYVVCASYAHTVALHGNLFDGDGGCDKAITEATAAQVPEK